MRTATIKSQERGGQFSDKEEEKNDNKEEDDKQNQTLKINWLAIRSRIRKRMMTKIKARQYRDVEDGNNEWSMKDNDDEEEDTDNYEQNTNSRRCNTKRRITIHPLLNNQTYCYLIAR